MHLIPRPAQVEYHAGSFIMTGIPDITGPTCFETEMQTLREQCADEPPDFGKRIICRYDDLYTGEDYQIQMYPDMVMVNAGTGAGAYHGLQILRQVLLSGRQVACATITDTPRFVWRGFMLDTARHFYTVPFIKKLIDVLSLHHINRFHWHLTDDQGWRLPIARYPLLTEIGSKRLECRPIWGRYTGGFYTEDEIRDVVAWAGARHIEVIPEVDLPGHASAILASYPGLGCTGGPYRVEDRHGIFEDALCAGNDGIFDLADAVFDTLTALFPSRYVHIGGDEVRFNRWQACPKCQQRLHETGLSSPRELQSWITVKLAEMLDKRGKTAIGWDEVLEDTDRYPLPKNMVIMSWRGREGGEAAAKRGYDAIMAPCTHGCYLDYRHNSDPEEPGQFGINAVLDTYALDPVAGLSDEAAAHIQGGQANLWSELIYAGKIAEYMIFPRICALAEALWSPRKDNADFADRLEKHRVRLDRLEVSQYRGQLER